MVKRVSNDEVYRPIQCPCCKRDVPAPDLDVIIEHYRLPNIQAAILRSVWKGRGHPVSAETIFNEMYADDPNGGPRTKTMYCTLKEGLSRMRKTLQGSGVGIETVGYRQGYRLVLGERE